VQYGPPSTRVRSITRKPVIAPGTVSVVIEGFLRKLRKGLLSAV
jgi:hypothetical protein